MDFAYFTAWITSWFIAPIWDVIILWHVFARWILIPWREIFLLSVILCLLGNHHPPVEFDCGKAVLIISRVFVSVWVRAYCAFEHMPRHCQLPLWLGGWEGERCYIAMKSMIHGSLDVTNKLSCHLILKQKGLTGEKTWKRIASSWDYFVSVCVGFLCQCSALWGRRTPNIGTYTSTLYISLQATLPPPPPPPPSLPSYPHFLPETFCQMLPDFHICAENELYPRALWVKDSLVKNAVLLDEQTNVPCNVVALAFYATLKESINLHNSNEHVLPLWRHG